MLIHVLLTIWIILICSLKPSTNINIKNNNIQRVSNLFVLASMGIIVLIAGLRTRVGDTSAYIKTFLSIQPGYQSLMSLGNYNGKGVLYRALVILCKTISGNYHFYLLFVAFISGMMIAKPLQKRTKYYDSSIILFMLMGIYLWMINGIRQFLAVALIFYDIVSTNGEKPLRTILAIFAAYLIHSSAIVMIPIYFVAKGKAWNWKTVTFIVASAIAVYYLDGFTKLLDTVTEGTEYENYTQKFAVENGSNPIHTMIYTVPPLISLIKRKEINQKATPLINLCINMSIITVAISLIANFTSGVLVGAMPIYFSVYSLILLPWLLNEIISEKNRSIIKSLTYVFYLVVFFMKTNGYGYYSDVLFGGIVFPSW